MQGSMGEGSPTETGQATPVCREDRVKRESPLGPTGSALRSQGPSPEVTSLLNKPRLAHCVQSTCSLQHRA